MSTEEEAGLQQRYAALSSARVLLGRSGSSYRTATLLQLRADHAAARDAVAAPLDTEMLDDMGFFTVQTEVADGAQHLRRPDLGRRLSAAARARMLERCVLDVDVQVVVGDGLSARAVAMQVPRLLPLLRAGVHARGWTWGTPFAVRYCRVGVMNDVGALLRPRAVVLLVGERPGLGTADSLSAYLAREPRPGHTDADRNLVAGIHDRGLLHAAAAERVLDLLAAMRTSGVGGVALKEPDHRSLDTSHGPPHPT